jgi:hypothetical protein
MKVSADSVVVIDMVVSPASLGGILGLERYLLEVLVTMERV